MNLPPRFMGSSGGAALAVGQVSGPRADSADDANMAPKGAGPDASSEGVSGGKTPRGRSSERSLGVFACRFACLRCLRRSIG